MTFRVGILGGGNISGTHARAAHQVAGVEVVAAWGANISRTSALCAQIGAKHYRELSAFLDHPGMDAVLIGSPPGVHAAHGRAAADHGLHVLVEKPMEISTLRTDGLIAACERAGVKLAVFFQDRTAPGVLWLKHLIDRGDLGRLLFVSARVKWYRDPDYYARSQWRGTWELEGGGALMTQGLHTADLLLWLVGDVDRVYARTCTALHDIEVEDTVVASLEFAGGALGCFEATTAAYPGYPRRLEFSGTEGTVILENDDIVAVDLRVPLNEPFPRGSSDDNIRTSTPVISDIRGHQRIIEDFVRAVREDVKPLCDGHEGRRSIVLAEAIYSSGRTGKAVMLGLDEYRARNR